MKLKLLKFKNLEQIRLKKKVILRMKNKFRYKQSKIFYKYLKMKNQIYKFTLTKLQIQKTHL